MTDLADACCGERQILLAKTVRIPVEEELKKAADKVKADFSKRETKIHMFPSSLRGLSKDGRQYIAPMALAIGPYHHGLDHLRQMEGVKQAAAYHFSRSSRHSPEKMYQEVRLRVADDARRLYADDAVAGTGNADNFAAMMFYDGCFLLQYMLMYTDSKELDPSLLCCFISNRACINHDIMLLENQIPWLVVEKLMSFKSVAVEKFIARLGRSFHIRRDLDPKAFVLDDSNRPPHLLGLLRFYLAGSDMRRDRSSRDGPKSMSISSAIELAEIGIKLTASKTTDFGDMDIKKGLLFGELFLAPLCLDHLKVCWLVNMAAFEVCTSTSFMEDDESTAVSSYLAVLAMLMDREEDVHELRKKRLMQGELTNKETLNFFKGLTKHMYGGPGYARIMVGIEAYKSNRGIRIKVHKFVYNNFRTIVTVLSIIGALAGIMKTLLSLKQR